MDTTILTLAELKDYLGIPVEDTSQDTQLGELLNALAPYIFTVTGVWFGSAKALTEQHDFNNVIFLNHVPIIDVATVKYRGAELPLANFAINKQTGRIRLSSWYSLYTGNRYDYDVLEVTYTTGIETVPAPIKEAAKMFARGLYNNAANDGLEITSEQVGSYRKMYKPSTREEDILASYRITNA